MEYEREVKQEVEFPKTMNAELMERWGDGIPVFAEADPREPEWQVTPFHPLDLSKEGYGHVWVKDESDRSSNPTGTIKDRAAWELATLYRDYARALYLKMKTGSLTNDALSKLPVPRLSLITSGNEGHAIAECFGRYNLPPPKLLLGINTAPAIVEHMLKLRADVYAVNLAHQLTPDAIKEITNNADGIDITSTRAIEPSSVFYDWHVHEVFNESPDEIYVPYGSGRLMENYLVWQARSMRNSSEGRQDPRLKVPVSKVINMNVFGAEPASYPSYADKLGVPFKPFLLFQDGDIRAMVSLAFTGSKTAKEPISEAHITQAHELFAAQGIEAEPSGAAGLALYLDRFEKGFVREGAKICVVNTGRGVTEHGV